MDHHVSALLLAAGQSRRMGQLKQLLPMPRKPAILCCLETIRAAGIEAITVVLGHERRKIAAAIGHLPVRLAVNPEDDTEMAASVRIGLDTLDADTTAVMVCLCDHPLVSPETLRRLVWAHVDAPDRIVIPTHHGKNGHPTLFPRDLIQKVNNGMHLQKVIAQHPSRVLRLPVRDPGAIFDLDTMDDYRAACALSAHAAARTNSE